MKSGRGGACLPETSVNAALYYLIVGATIGRPRSLRLQNAYPSVAKRKSSIKFVGTDVLGGPKKQEINISFWSVIFVLKTYGYSICNRYELGPSRTPVPTELI